ncbi:hypothetical protein AUJ77_02550 [Candidatus Nomurabacteria bacterium CG1_02_43_90]|uniref:Uncharacterized protein n=1 Tax=Candidatus Nomurabacteria bacterium CG1_02_43_90 TaxID=1805281 RepID=A0A1J4V8T2_9BACT|nr:MAG: hypothetical protein AUJ77_02550 [Candidatus Nomurabacteria bacterium CG1_02_43_90]
MMTKSPAEFPPIGKYCKRNAPNEQFFQGCVAYFVHEFLHAQKVQLVHHADIDKVDSSQDDQ